MNVLLVEDDERVSLSLRDVLGRHGFTVTGVGTGRAALRLVDDSTEAVVLDLGLPDLDGTDVCARLRTRWDGAIIVATARGDLGSRLHGLHLGADDYLVKPFDARELMARLHAVTRRRRGESPGDAVAARGGSGTDGGAAPGAGLVVDVVRRSVTLDGRPVALTRKEFDVLALLARAPGVVFPRDHILSEVWRVNDRLGAHTLEVHVGAIRSKTRPDLIETVRGVGYRAVPGRVQRR